MAETADSVFENDQTEGPSRNGRRRHLRPRRVSLRMVILLLVLLPLLLAGLIHTVTMAQTRQRAVLERVDAKLLTAARAQQRMLPPGYFDAIENANSVSLQQFERIVDTNNRFCRADGLQYVWSVLMRDERHVYFTSSTSPDHEVHSGLHAKFYDLHSDPESFGPALVTMEPTFATFHNEWGWGRMVLIPNRDNHGRVIMFGASMAMPELQAAKRDAILGAAAEGGATIILGALLSLLVSQRISTPIRRAATVACDIAAGRYDSRIVPRGPREVAMLSESLAAMRDLIRDRIAALRESEAKYRALAENISDVVYSMDAEGILTYLSPQAARYGFRPEQMVGQRFDHVIVPEDRDHVLADFQRTLATGEEFFTELRIQDAQGHVHWLEEQGKALRDDTDRIVGITGVLRNITTRKQAEMESQRYQERLRSLAMELSLAEERERKRLAVLLHDDVSQLIIAMKLRLPMLDALDDPAARKAWTAQFGRIVDRAIHSTRSLTRQLSNLALYDMGLTSAAKWLAQDIEELHGLRVALDVPQERDPLDERVRAVLFQCIRELLMNVAKHAQTEQARLWIVWQEGRLRIGVEDDGQGFDMAATRSQPRAGGFGLFSICERVEMLGGRFDIRSAPGEGTTVILELPVHSAGADPAMDEEACLPASGLPEPTERPAEQ